MTGSKRTPYLPLMLAVGLLAIAGCTGIRTEGIPPAIPLQPNFAPGQSHALPPELRAGWWRVSGQAAFAKLAERALTQNYGIQDAAARLNAARAARGAVGDAFRPQTTFGPRLRSERTETRVRDGLAGAADRTVQHSSLRVIGGDASWEIDLFGRAAMQGRAAEADIANAATEVASARLSVATELMRSYALLGLAETEEKLLTRSLDARRRVLLLVRERAAAGLASELDVVRAETEVRRLEGQLPRAAADRAAQRAAIGALLGDPKPFAGPAPVIELARFRFASIPADVLRRRPDVRTAASNIVRAAAERDIAEADLYPRLTLSGDLTLGRGLSGDVVSSVAGALGPSLQIPLFDHDLRQARLAEREATLEATSFDYRDRVVTAAGEVWRGLSALREARRQMVATQAALAAARRAEILSEQLFRAGTIGLNDRLVVSTAALEAEADLINSRRQEAEAVVALLKATAPQ